MNILRSVIAAIHSWLSASSANGTPAGNHNEAFSDLSRMFFNNLENPTFGLAHLDRQKLDFSVESLKHVDEYLEIIRKEPEIANDWTRIVLRAGAYVGEVLRLNDAKAEWRWIDYDTAKVLNPQFFGEMPLVAASSAMLYNEKSGFTFPLAKIEKYLENGNEDSTLFFVQVMLAKQS